MVITNYVQCLDVDACYAKTVKIFFIIIFLFKGNILSFVWVYFFKALSYFTLFSEHEHSNMFKRLIKKLVQ